MIFGEINIVKCENVSNNNLLDFNYAAISDLRESDTCIVIRNINSMLTVIEDENNTDDVFNVVFQFMCDGVPYAIYIHKYVSNSLITSAAIFTILCGTFKNAPTAIVLLFLHWSKVVCSRIYGTERVIELFNAICNISTNIRKTCFKSPAFDEGYVSFHYSVIYGKYKVNVSMFRYDFKYIPSEVNSMFDIISCANYRSYVSVTRSIVRSMISKHVVYNGDNRNIFIRIIGTPIVLYLSINVNDMIREGYIDILTNAFADVMEIGGIKEDLIN